MGPVLDGLVNLQSVENRLRAAKGKLTRCRRSVIIQENQVRSLQSSLNAKHEEIQLTKIQSDRLELELKSRDDSIAKLRAALNTAKTNKEYAAVLTQLNTNKADNSKIETQVLELMRDIEADEQESEKISEQIEEQKQLLEQKRKDAESSADKYESQIDQIQTQWDELSVAIPPEALEVFKRVAETYDGEALSVIVTHDRGGYSCGGCFMSTTAETVSLLMSKDEIFRCPNCARILVLGETTL